MRARRSVARQSEHAWAKRRQDSGRRGDRRADERSLVHRVQVRGHLFVRALGGPVALLVEERVRHAQSEHEPAGVSVLEGPRGVRHRHRIARGDAGDAGRDDDVSPAAQEDRRVRHGLLAGRLADPNGSVPELGDPGDRLLRQRGRLPLQLRGPHAERTEPCGERASPFVRRRHDRHSLSSRAVRSVRIAAT